MANKRFWLGMLVMVLAGGIMVVGCEEEETSDDATGDPKLVWGEWKVVFYADAVDGGNSTINVSVIDGRLIINGELKSNYTYPYATWRAEPNPANLEKLRTTATTISFKVIGDGKLYKVRLVTSDKEAAEDWNFVAHTFTAPNNSEESTITLNLADFQPETGWGNTVPHDKTKITCIQFERNGNAESNTNMGGFSLSMRDLTVGDGDDSSSGGELWSKLIGTWVKDNNSYYIITFAKIREDSSGGFCELSISGSYTGKFYVKLNRASYPWFGNIPSPKNFSLGGSSTDAGTLTFSSADTKMSISGSALNGSYTKN
jgi:hypothetical protein